MDELRAEAAMIGRNIAPGLGRKFASEEWEFVDSAIWKEERRKAYEAITQEPLSIFASDVDPRSMKAAMENAANAGVEEDIQFKQINITDMRRAYISDAIGGRTNEDHAENGVIIVNPPYGKRIGEEKAIETVYGSLRKFHEDNPDWSIFMITADKTAEKKVWGRPADRRRKLYNGNVETCYYQFHGERKQY